MSTSVRLETNENTTGKYQAADKECEECSGNSWAALSLPDILAQGQGTVSAGCFLSKGF